MTQAQAPQSQDRPLLTPLRPSSTAPDQGKAASVHAGGLAAGTGGSVLSQLKGSSSNNTKDGAKEDLKKINLVKVYQRLFPGKEVGQTRGSETQVSCFSTAGHANGDRNPSMSINTSLNVYKCFGCEIQGDIIDMVAHRIGIENSAGKCPTNMVHKAVYEASNLLNLGWEFHQASDGNHYRTQDYQKLASVTSLPTAVQQRVIQADTEPLNAAAINLPDDVDGGNGTVPVLDWRNLIENDTALRVYMEQVSQDDIAEEYHFWNFMLLLGLLIGRDAALADSPMVYGNLFICLSGPTSAGKSRSMSHIKNLISRDEIAWDESDAYSDGIKRIKQPGSGESMTKSFIHESADPAATGIPALTPGGQPKKRAAVPKVTHPVRGLIEFEELASLVAKSDNRGSTIKTSLIEIYDCGPSVGGTSLAHGSYEAFGAFGCVMSSVQPEILESMFSGTTDSASGFLNRWLFIPGNHKKRAALGKTIDLDPVVPYLVEIRDWAADIKRSGGTVDFAYTTQSNRFIKFCDDVIFKNDSTNGLQRLHLLYKKLVLLSCALYHEEHVTDRAMDLAEHLIEWIIEINRTQRIDQLDTSANDKYSERIIAFLQKAGIEGLPPSKLTERVKQGMKASFNLRDYEYMKNQMINDDLIVMFQPEGSRKKRLVDGDTFRAHTK